MTSTSRPSVSASAMSYLLLVMVRDYHEKGKAGKAQLEEMGAQLGARLAERYTKDRPRFTEHTEVVLWTCKEFWQETFGKRVDNLKTNNRGVYVLTDVAFKWMSGLRPFGGDTEEESWALMMAYADSYGAFAGGVVRGALESLGLRCQVSPEPTCQSAATATSIEEFKPLGCKFTVRLAAGLGFGGVA